MNPGVLSQLSLAAARLRFDPFSDARINQLPFNVLQLYRPCFAV
jgi:hypothetical protein